MKYKWLSNQAGSSATAAGRRHQRGLVALRGHQVPQE